MGGVLVQEMGSRSVLNQPGHRPGGRHHRVGPYARERGAPRRVINEMALSATDGRRVGRQRGACRPVVLNIDLRWSCD